LRSIRNVSASYRAPFESLLSKLRAHRAVTRISIAAFSLALVFAVSHQGISNAGPEPAAAPQLSILPISVGTGVASNAPISLEFDQPMDRASVESGLSILPEISVAYQWSADGRTLNLVPERRWLTDSRYVVVVPGAVRHANGSALDRPMRLSFTTQTAPTVSDFQLRYVPDQAASSSVPVAPDRQLKLRADGLGIRASQAPSPTTPADTATEVSSRTSVTVGFSSQMDADDVARSFSITPEVAGDLSWVGNSLTFTPAERLQPGARYAISLAGAHDRIGNPLGGDTSFSFTTTEDAQLIKISPKSNESGVTDRQVELWFSKPMQSDATGKAFSLTDTTAKARVAGTISWNEDNTQLRFRPSAALARGHTFQVALSGTAADADGNALQVTSTFRTEAPPKPKATAKPRTTSRPASGPVAPSPTLAGYALNQVNAARGAYGFGKLSLSGQVSAVSQAYANEMLRTGHFSHVGVNGSTRESRLRAGGVSFGFSGENICYRSGYSVQSTLNWCHSQFMAEPYPGVYNHIANILSPRYHRLGVGIASDGNRVYVVWDFVD
jgi:uncharacterized protein YkwD